MRTAPGHDGVVPALTAHDLLESVDELGDIAHVTAETLTSLPSASLATDDVLRLLERAREQVRLGADGVVVTQGTDTLEETAYLAHLLWDLPEPLVFTGAMRSPARASADGPANLAAACLVAVSDAARGTGALVVMDDHVHEACWVQKLHSTALGAFGSPARGPLGRVVEGRVELHRPARPSAPWPAPTWDPYVPLLATHLGDDGRSLRALCDAGAHGLVVAAFGAGHVPAAVADGIEEAAEHVPVVIASRTRAGGTLRSTYGFEGSEIDLARRGAILAGELDPAKARLRLWLALASGLPQDAIRDRFRNQT